MEVCLLATLEAVVRSTVGRFNGDAETNSTSPELALILRRFFVEDSITLTTWISSSEESITIMSSVRRLTGGGTARCFPSALGLLWGLLSFEVPTPELKKLCSVTDEFEA